MAKNVIDLTVDIKHKLHREEPVVRQNDSLVFEMVLKDDNVPFVIEEGTTATLATLLPDGSVVVVPSKSVDLNTVVFHLGTTETSQVGRIVSVVQLYSADGRVSSMEFSYRVVRDFTNAGYEESERDRSLIEIVLVDGPTVIQAARDATAEALEAAEIARNAIGPQGPIGLSLIHI